jgi:benzoate-CoA ligase family protein
VAELAARTRDASPELEAIPAAATATCFWLYSSGSTGRPKAAVHRHRDMVATSELFGRTVLGIREDEVIFSAAKLFFAYGLGNAMTFPLWCGATSVLLDARPTAGNTFETIERFRPTLYFGVPTLYAAQLQALETARPDLSSIALCVSAGEPLPAELFRRWKERTGLTILDGIGSTEALNTFISNRAGDVRPGTSGKPVPGYEVRIVTASGGPAAVGEQGRLQVKGPSTAAFYWNDPEKTRQTMQGDWIDTGDAYLVDEDGQFVYQARTDDMIVSGGYNIAGPEVEAALLLHPAVGECGVVGAFDEARGQIVKAFVVLRPGYVPGDALVAELQAFCKETIAPYKYPRAIVFRQHLPRTETGKLQRYLLRQMG